MIAKDEAAVLDKLCGLGDKFQTLFFERKYIQAMFTYHTASIVALFMEVDQDILNFLFGTANSEETDVKGIFNRDFVQKARWECVKADKSVPYVSAEEMTRILVQICMINADKKGQ